MTHRFTLFAALVLAAGCTAAPATAPKAGSSTAPDATSSKAPSTSPSTKASTPATTPASTAASATASGAGSRTADSVMLKVDGVETTVAPTFELSGSGNNAQWKFDKPSGYAPKDKWYFDIGVNGKTMNPMSADFTAADISAVTLVFRQGTSATTPERVYSGPQLTATQYTLADGKLDINFSGKVDKLAFGAGGDGPASFTFDLVVKGVSLK